MVSGRDNVQVLEENNKAANNRESVQYDYPTRPPVDSNCYTPAVEYEFVADTKDDSADRNDAYSAPKVPEMTVNPSYMTNDAVVHNMDEQ